MDLKNKVAVVTGASGGIGSAAAQRLAEAGARVIVGYNSKAAEAEKIAASLPGSGHKALRIQVLDSPSLKELAATVERRDDLTDHVAIGEATADGSGKLVFADATVSPGGRYADRLAWLEGATRRSTS